MTASVSRDRRHTRAHPCPICKGFDEQDRGEGKRCSGFTSEDGLWIRCSRIPSPRVDDRTSPPTYRHLARDKCACGVRHELAPDSPRTSGPTSGPDRAEYIYCDETGDEHHKVAITGHGEGKKVGQFKIEGGKWVKGAPEKRILYRLPELLGADDDAIVYFVEGERDVETLRRRGLVATTMPGGTPGWAKAKASAREHLAGRTVIVIADADDVGRKHARHVVEDIRSVVKSVRVVECTKGKDVTDHFAAGGAIEEVVEMAEPSASRKTPKGTLHVIRGGADSADEPPDDELPEIAMGPDLHRVLEELDYHLGTRDPLLFQRSNQLVDIAGSQSKHKLADGTPVVRPLTGPALAPRVTRHIAMTAYVKPAAEESRDHKKQTAVAGAMGKPAPPPPRFKKRIIQPPPGVLSALIAAQDWHHVRHLRGVTESPIFRPDGSVRQEPGYDEATGYLYIPSCEYPPVPESPTQADAQAALAELLDVFCDFPYVNPESKLVPISAILSIVGRAAIDGPVPAHLFDASVMGSGKTIQCDIAHAIAVGRVPAHATWPAQDEDQEKLLGSYAIAAPAGIVIDNIKGIFGGPAIEQTLTSTSVQFRILGKSEIRTLSWRIVVMLSGNNLSLTDDMIRRTLLSRLESPLEDPTSRTDFKRPELLEWVMRERPRLAVLALTILRAYAIKGFPDTGVRLASYGAWARVVAGSIRFAMPPGMTGGDVTRAQPPRERAALDDSGAAAQLIACWPSPDPISMKSLLAGQYPAPRGEDLPHGSDDVREAIEALAPPKGPAGPSAIALAKKLSKFKGRWFGERRLVFHEDPHTKTMLWRVEKR